MRSARTSWCAAVALLAGTVLGVSREALAQPAPPAGVQLGTRVQPDTVAVGDPFVVTIRVRAPRGATIEFPLAPDSASAVELLDPRAVRSLPDTTAVEQTATYRAAAWDVGPRRFGFSDVVVRAGGVERRASLRDVAVQVRSVLPADTAQRIPKPPRDLVAPVPPWWIPWLIGLAVLAVLALLGWLLWRWLRRRRPTADDPYAAAQAAFDRVEAMGLVGAGERGRHVALMVEVVRAYIARVAPTAPRSHTSTELAAALLGSSLVPVPRLAALLDEADLIKFARQPVAADRARSLGTEARGIVDAVHDEVEREAEATRRREAEAREQAEAADRDARKRSRKRAA